MCETLELYSIQDIQCIVIHVTIHLYLDSYRSEIHGYHEGLYPKYAHSTSQLAAKTEEWGGTCQAVKLMMLEKRQYCDKSESASAGYTPYVFVGMIHTCIAAH